MAGCRRSASLAGYVDNRQPANGCESKGRKSANHLIFHRHSRIDLAKCPIFIYIPGYSHSSHFSHFRSFVFNNIPGYPKKIYRGGGVRLPLLTQTSTPPRRLPWEHTRPVLGIRHHLQLRFINPLVLRRGLGAGRSALFGRRIVNSHAQVSLARRERLVK